MVHHLSFDGAVGAGSLECVELLLSLGADNKPLADQELFTCLAMTSCDKNLGVTGRSRGTYLLLRLLADSVRMHTRLDPPQEAVQALLDGRYAGTESQDGETPGSPLELAISVQNYDSVIALLNLGADPNASRDEDELNSSKSRSLEKPRRASAKQGQVHLKHVARHAPTGTFRRLCQRKHLRGAHPGAKQQSRDVRRLLFAVVVAGKTATG